MRKLFHSFCHYANWYYLVYKEADFVDTMLSGAVSPTEHFVFRVLLGTSEKMLVPISSSCLFCENGRVFGAVAVVAG